jgi:hypothetical protein
MSLGTLRVGLISCLPASPALEGGEIGNRLGEVCDWVLGVWVGARFDRPNPTAGSFFGASEAELCESGGAFLSPASTIAFSSSNRVGSFIGDFALTGEEGAGDTLLPQRVAAPFTDMLLGFSGDLAGLDNLWSVTPLRKGVLWAKLEGLDGSMSSLKLNAPNAESSSFTKGCRASVFGGVSWLSDF